MNCFRATLSWLALAILSVGSAMAASPRDTPQYHAIPRPETPEERRGRQIAEMEAVLGRLVGQFGLERPWVFADEPMESTNVWRTMMDCMTIGEGKGLHCVWLAVRPPPVPADPPAAGTNQQAPNRRLRPGGGSMADSFTQYGIDPNASRVRVIKVTRGTAVQMAGSVSGDTLTMAGRCWNSPECEIQQRITVSADGENLRVTEYSGWEPSQEYALHRLSQEEVDAANWSVEGAPPTVPTKPGRPR